VKVGLVLELLDLWLEVLFLTVLSWWILDHVRKVFDELSMRM
jgi:hypothetical protein